MVVIGASDGKGLYALGMLSHEASIIATEERAEMRMIEFFIPRKLSFDGTEIQSQRAGILEGQSAGQIKAAMIFVRTKFVNVHVIA